MISVKIKSIDSAYSEHDALRAGEILKLICQREPSVCAHVDAILAKKDVTSRISSIIAFQTLLKMCAEAKIDLGSLSIEKNALGRPSFRARTDIDFNISHTEKHVAVALATGAGARVGIDVESTAREAFLEAERRKKIAARFFCNEELRRLEEKNWDMEKFIELWTRKEAYLKYTGEGLGKMADTDTFTCADDNVAFITDTVGVIGTNAYFTLCYSPKNQVPMISCED